MIVVKSLYSITKLGLFLCVNPYEDNVLREAQYINELRKKCGIQLLEVTYGDVCYQHHRRISNLQYHNDIHLHCNAL